MEKKLILFWAALIGLIVACAAISQPDDSTMDADTFRVLREIEKQSIPRSFVSGEIIGIKIGYSKDDAVRHLRELGISHLKLEVQDKVRVSDPKELDQLRYAGAVILFPGDARFTFEGDRVLSKEILPSVREGWTRRLQVAGSREEVLAVFSDMLE